MKYKYSMDTAIILAGGKSTRMGFDKQQIKVGEITITEYIINKLRAFFKEIIVVTNNFELYKNKNTKVIEDIYKGVGPLAGIHAGLLESKSDFNYIIACDMPFINIKYIEYMKKRITESDSSIDAVTTASNGLRETMNSFYAKKLIPVVERRIKDNNKSILGLLDVIDVLYIDEEITKRFSPDWKMFTNLNIEKDLKHLNKLSNMSTDKIY